MHLKLLRTLLSFVKQLELAWKLTLGLLWERPLVLATLVTYLVLFGLLWVWAVPLRSPSLRWVEMKELLMQKGRNRHSHDLLPAAKVFGREVVVVKEGREGAGTNGRGMRGSRRLLEEIFHRADTDNDNYLSREELTVWIGAKIQEHLNQALQENFFMFTAIDKKPRDGVISWDEYHAFFLKQKGLDAAYVNNHTERHSELSRTIKEMIMRDKAAWSEAARSDPDHLNIDEFLAFRHPESSHSTLLTMVQELIDKFDEDGDEILTEEEFSNTEVSDDNIIDNEEEVNKESQKEKEQKRKLAAQERQKEFREVIDVNHDGQVDRKELLMYINPRNPRHAKEETDTLFSLADTNHDDLLSLTEVWNKMDLFLGSKMVDTARSFHDEF